MNVQTTRPAIPITIPSAATIHENVNSHGFCVSAVTAINPSATRERRIGKIELIVAIIKIIIGLLEALRLGRQFRLFRDILLSFLVVFLHLPLQPFRCFWRDTGTERIRFRARCLDVG